MPDRKLPAVFDIEKLRDLMTNDGYDKFVKLLREIGTREENTLVLVDEKPICVFIPGWKLGKAIGGLT